MTSIIEQNAAARHMIITAVISSCLIDCACTSLQQWRLIDTYNKLYVICALIVTEYIDWEGPCYMQVTSSIHGRLNHVQP